MTLCLVAGTGRLPSLLAPHADHVAALEGTDTEIAVSRRFQLETLGSFLAELEERGVDRVCFAGGITRPPVDLSRIDAATAPLVPRIAAALGQGDDAALREVLALFAEHGMAPLAAHEVLPDLLPDPGAVSRLEPGATDLSDMARGFEVLRLTGAADIGQGCVVGAGQVLAVEAMPGTDWMLESVAAGRGPDAPAELRLGSRAGGVLVKAPKPEQDRRVDLPAIGPDTVSRAAKAGLVGIAIAAGGVMVLESSELRSRADAAGLWIWVAE